MMLKWMKKKKNGNLKVIREKNEAKKSKGRVNQSMKLSTRIMGIRRMKGWKKKPNILWEVYEEAESKEGNEDNCYH